MIMADCLKLFLYQDLGVGRYVSAKDIRMVWAGSLLSALKIEAYIKRLTAHSSCLPRSSVVEGEAEEV